MYTYKIPEERLNITKEYFENTYKEIRRLDCGVIIRDESWGRNNQEGFGHSVWDDSLGHPVTPIAFSVRKELGYHENN